MTVWTKYLVAMSWALLLSCGADDNLVQVKGTIDGYVYVTGPVSGAQVSAFKLDLATGQAGELVATSEPTDELGKFHLDLGIKFGPMLLVAAGVGATYAEPASAVVVAFDSSAELRAVFVERAGPSLTFDFERGSNVTDFVISPWSDLAHAYATARPSAATNLPLAFEESHKRFADYVRHDFWSVVPADMGQPTGGWNTNVEAGAELAAWSRLVRWMADDSQISHAGLTSLQLLTLLRRDLSGPGAALEGFATGSPTALRLGDCTTICTLSARTLSGDLAQALAAFLGAPENKSGITISDAQGLIEFLACPWLLSPGAGELFDPTAVSTGSCTLDTQAPSLKVELLDEDGEGVPLQDATILSDTPAKPRLRITAEDNLDMKAIDVTFTDVGGGTVPATFFTVEEESPSKQRLVQTLTLTTANAVDGAYKLKVVASDELPEGQTPHTTVFEQTVIVDNSGDSLVSGTVTIGGRVKNARVRAYVFDGSVASATVLAEAFTNEDGVYVLSVPDTAAKVLLLEAGVDPVGATTFVDAATEATVTLSAADTVRSILVDWQNGAVREDGHLTPWTDVAVALATPVWEHTFSSSPAKWPDAVTAAFSMLEQHFVDGGQGILLREVSPANLTVEDAANSTLTASVRYGLMIAGLSQQAADHAALTGASPASMNTLTLMAKLAADASVCASQPTPAGTLACLDGRDIGSLSHGVQALDSYTTRRELANAAAKFVKTNPHDATPFSELDVLALLDAISFDSGEREPGQPWLYPSKDVGGPYDTVDPELVFLEPANNTVLRGTRLVRVQATDDRALEVGSLQFTAPLGQLSGISISGDTLPGGGIDYDGPWIRSGTLNAEASNDGELFVDVVVKDQAQHVVTKKLRLIVDKTNPTGSITGATAGGQPLSNGGVTGATSANVTYSASDTNFASATLKVGTMTAHTTTMAGTFTASVPLAPGANTVVLTVTDKAGNTASASATYNRDATPPTTELFPALFFPTSETAVLSPAGTGPATSVVYSTPGPAFPLTDNTSFFKYAGNYGPASSNLPTWQFNVTDGSPGAIQFRVRVLQASSAITDWIDVPDFNVGTHNRTVVLSSALTPKIAEVSGAFALEYQAIDVFGNASPVGKVNWTQTLRASPIRQRQGSAACSGGAAYGMCNGLADNLAHRVVNGVGLPDERVWLAEGYIDNPSTVPVRVRLTVASVSATYSMMWRSKTYETGSGGGSDNCSNNSEGPKPHLPSTGACYNPSQDTSGTKVNQTAGNLVADLLVRNLSTGQVIPQCLGCAWNEREILAKTTARVDIRSKPWSWLWSFPTIGLVNLGAAVGVAGFTTPEFAECTVYIEHPTNPNAPPTCGTWKRRRQVTYLSKVGVIPAPVKVSLQSTTANQFNFGIATGDNLTDFAYYTPKWCDKETVPAETTAHFTGCP
jgi:hypothetical protein